MLIIFCGVAKQIALLSAFKPNFLKQLDLCAEGGLGIVTPPSLVKHFTLHSVIFVYQTVYIAVVFCFLCFFFFF